MSAPNVPGTPRRILIVDDDQATRSGLKRFFERANYEVAAVSTFADGRIALSESPPDLLIADVRLGEFNGLQLIVTNPRPIPTIIVTGYPDPVLEADARALGADYLLKPVLPSALLSLVKEKLEGAGESAPILSPRRRWTRRPVDDLSARVGEASARVLDISYGGLRLAFERYPEQALPPSFNIVLPVSGVSVPVDLVWTVRSPDGAWMCGAAIAAGQAEAASAWQGVVDGLVGP